MCSLCDPNDTFRCDGCSKEYPATEANDDHGLDGTLRHIYCNACDDELQAVREGRETVPNHEDMMVKR